MTTPIRVQLRRSAGWRLPAGAVSVARPGRWGNPYEVSIVCRRYPSLTVDECHGFAVAEFRDLLGAWTFEWPDTSAPREQKDWIPKVGGGRELRTCTYPSIDEIREELAGKDLACWCALDKPCHADVLLWIANGEELGR